MGVGRKKPYYRMGVLAIDSLSSVQVHKNRDSLLKLVLALNIGRGWKILTCLIAFSTSCDVHS
jgi:hypothetical protein